MVKYIAQQALEFDVNLVLVRSAQESLKHARQWSCRPLKVDHFPEELVDASRDGRVIAKS